jgi:alpha-beta hydrolase superfamily lysophospholipase
MLRSDVVLVVQDIAQRALGLGPTVTVSRVQDALHDVFLSRPPVRQAAYAAVQRWMRGYLSGS